jgi:multidrug transporter EmrE-like cation transporter
MDIVLFVVAAVAYSVGGLCMKLSDGLRHVRPTLSVLALFSAGAMIQTLGLRRVDLSVGYVFVLGLEAALTAALSVWYLQENCPPQRVAAIILVVAGIIWLRAT